MLGGNSLTGNMLSVVAYLPWVQGGTSSPVAVNAPNPHGLGFWSNWFEVSGSVLGFANSSAVSFSWAEVLTHYAASTCQGDTAANVDPRVSCPGLANFLPLASVSQAGNTQETNNLVPPSTVPTLNWLNTDLVVMNYLLQLRLLPRQFQYICSRACAKGAIFISSL